TLSVSWSHYRESLQNKYIRVRIISDKGNAKGNTATSDAN
ncbi:hypothetical protein, partial [Salmonella enterica]